MAKFTSRLALIALSFALPLVRGADTPAPLPDAAATLADTENKLSTALRSYELLQRENDRLKATVASQHAELDKLHQQLSAPPDFPDATKELAETKDKLATALRSYSLLDAENDRLKSAAAKSAAATQSASTKMSAESAAQLSSLYDQLRQTRAQLASVFAENAELRTRLGLAAPTPGSARPNPSRAAASAPLKTPNAEVETNALPSRTHVVAAGDTLAAISQQYYGTPDRWPDILRANRDVIKGQSVLPLGVTLRLP